MSWFAHWLDNWHLTNIWFRNSGFQRQIQAEKYRKIHLHLVYVQDQSMLLFLLFSPSTWFLWYHSRQFPIILKYFNLWAKKNCIYNKPSCQKNNIYIYTILYFSLNELKFKWKMLMSSLTLKEYEIIPSLKHHIFSTFKC